MNAADFERGPPSVGGGARPTPTPPPPASASTQPPGASEVHVVSPEECLLTCVERISAHDSSRFFSDPVTEEVAPGYFSVIKNPMDFFTIRKKIRGREYRTYTQVSCPSLFSSPLPTHQLANLVSRFRFQFAADLELICSNALLYNQKRTRGKLSSPSLPPSLSSLTSASRNLQSTRPHPTSSGACERF